MKNMIHFATFFAVLILNINVNSIFTEFTESDMNSRVDK